MNRIPLRYQATEFDCGSAAVINAISYIFGVSDFPAYFLKEIYDVCLDEYNADGLLGGDGTSQDAMRFLAGWFNRYREKTGFPIRCSCFDGKDVAFADGSKLLDLLRREGVAVVVRCVLYDEHYVTLTGADESYIYLFDPYYWNVDYRDPRIARIDDPFRANRKLPIGFMETTTGSYYSLGAVKEKIAVAFSRKDES